MGTVAGLGCSVAAFGMHHLATTTVEISYIPQAILSKLNAKKDAVAVVSGLIPWFTFSMVPLALANVLLSNLLARQQFQVVLYLVAIVVLYTLTLMGFGRSFVGVVQILGCFNLLYFAVLALFTWLDARRQAQLNPEQS